MAKILILDIETAPNVAYVWRFFKEFIGPDQVLQNSTMMSFAAKWLGSDAVMYDDCRKTLDDSMIVWKLNQLLDEADIVVAHNGKKFDIPYVAARSLVLGYKPISPFKLVDTVLVAKNEFKFESNSLKYLAQVLDLKHQKKDHEKFPGFKLWLECLRNNNEAWDEMEKYNIMDVLCLEELYLKMRPWMNRHPNIGVFLEEDKHVCPKCGSDHQEKRGFAYTNTGKYQQFRCKACGGWSRGRYTLYPKDKRANLVVNQVN